MDVTFIAIVILREIILRSLLFVITQPHGDAVKNNLVAIIIATSLCGVLSPPVKLYKNRKIYLAFLHESCNIGVFLSFQSSSRSAGHQLAIDGPDYGTTARISRILAVFGFSSPILETHQLVYLVL